MKLLAALLALTAVPATAQVVQQDRCAGLYGFARDDCVAYWQSIGQDQERQKQLQLQLQQELIREQIRGQQLQNEMLRRKLEAEDAAAKKR